MAVEIPVEEQIRLLDQAKAALAQDPAHYPDLARGILKIAQKPNTSLRRWCSSFFIDALTSFSLEDDQRQALAVECIDTVLVLLQDEDFIVLKNTITVAASVYPLGFAFVAQDESQSLVWNNLVAIKNQVLKLWDSPHFGVEAESIKFVQQVIILQLFGNRDPRLSANSDFSLSSVPSNHALIHSSLEAEAQGLLDRLLGVFVDAVISAKSITATTYAISALMKLRPATISKCLRAVLSFNISQKTINPAFEKETEMEFKVVEKALKIFLQHVLKSNMAVKYNPQIQGFLSTLGKSQERHQERNQERHPEKRQAKSQIIKQEAPKRIKVEVNPMPPNPSTVVPPGPYSYASLYSLLDAGNPLREFNTKSLPLDLALNITLAGIASSNPDLMKNSINIVKTRYENFLQQANSRASGAGASRGRGTTQDPRVGNAGSSALPNEKDDSDYDPTETSTKLVDPRNNSNDVAAEDAYDSDEDMEYLQPAASFVLQPPAKLNEEERLEAVKTIVDRMISYDKVTTSLQALPSGAANANKGIDRVAVTEWTRNTWVILVSRLLTRGFTDPSNRLESPPEEEKRLLKVQAEVARMSESIRESLFAYAMENFRERLDIIIEWLNEEWFGEFVQYGKDTLTMKKESGDETKPDVSSKFESKKDSNYYKYTTKVLDYITPFLSKSDRPQFLRLLSDLPELDTSHVRKLKGLCIDPERRDLGMGSLL